MFYYDNFRRILLKEPNKLRIFRVEEIVRSSNVNNMNSDENNNDTNINSNSPRYELIELFVIDSKNPTQIETRDMEIDPKPKLIRTSSGRTVRFSSPATASPEDPIISSVDYEDELDLLVVGMRGSAFIYKNSTGKFLREIPFGNYWIVDGKNSVILDKNQIILLSSKYFESSCTIQIFDFDFGGKRPDNHISIANTPEIVQSDRVVLREYAYDSDYTP